MKSHTRNNLATSLLTHDKKAADVIRHSSDFSYDEDLGETPYDIPETCGQTRDNSDDDPDYVPDSCEEKDDNENNFTYFGDYINAIQKAIVNETCNIA